MMVDRWEIDGWGDMGNEEWLGRDSEEGHGMVGVQAWGVVLGCAIHSCNGERGSI